MQFRLMIGGMWVALLLPALQVAVVSASVAVDEICNNAKDDDNDGLIDLNDPDCACQVIRPESLIPNPSFEEINCCPQNNGALNCANGWIQASEATTDFLHTCGWMGVSELPPPLPFPDGEACVGIRNGSSFVNWKEYAGACLLAPMRIGVQYRLRFHVGFTQAINSPLTTLALFGTTDCNNLPFGIGIPDFGCPLNHPGWKQLGFVTVQGDMEWQVKEINFTPLENIRAIALGPDCTPGILNPEAYYFLDNLILDELADFEFAITATGAPCTNDFTLQVPAFDSLQYQWYKDGIALPGETRPRLKIQGGEGSYVARVVSAAECKVAMPYQVSNPVIVTQGSETICKGETYRFGDRMLDQPGVYRDTFRTVFYCDSIVELNLLVDAQLRDTMQVKIFAGDHVRVGTQRFDQAGQYEIPLQSEAGCDSLIYLDLQFFQVFVPNVFSPDGDGNNDVFTVFGGVDLKLINELQVFDRWGNVIFQSNSFLPNDAAGGWDGFIKGKSAPSGVYVYMARVRMDNDEERRLSGTVLLIR